MDGSAKFEKDTPSQLAPRELLQLSDRRPLVSGRERGGDVDGELCGVATVVAGSSFARTSREVRVWVSGKEMVVHGRWFQ